MCAAKFLDRRHIADRLHTAVRQRSQYTGFWVGVAPLNDFALPRRAKAANASALNSAESIKIE